MWRDRIVRGFSGIPLLVLQFYAVIAFVGLIWVGALWYLHDPDSRPNALRQQVTESAIPLARTMAEQIARTVQDGTFKSLKDWENRLSCCLQTDTGVVGLQILLMNEQIRSDMSALKPSDSVAEVPVIINKAEMGFVRIFVRGNLNLTQANNARHLAGALTLLFGLAGFLLWLIVIGPFQDDRQKIADLLQYALQGGELNDLHPGEWHDPFSRIVRALATGDAHCLHHRAEVESYAGELMAIDFDGQLSVKIAQALAEPD